MILYVFLMLWLLGVATMGHSERKIWGYCFTNMWPLCTKIIRSWRQNFSFAAPVIGFLATVSIFIVLPIAYLFDPAILTRQKLAGGSFSVLLAADRDYDTTMKMFDKFYWYKIFTRHNIKTPKVHAIIENQNVSWLFKAEEKKYIFKPILGSLGSDITFETLSSFLKKRHTEPFLMQDRIIDPESSSARHFRLITVSEKSGVYKFILFQNRQSGREIASNITLGASREVCADACENASRETNAKIAATTAQLIRLHEDEFKFSPSIGWDFVVGDDGCYLLEGNPHSGITARPDHQAIRNANKKIMDRIYRESHETKRNILSNVRTGMAFCLL